MGRGLGKIQIKILETLETMEERHMETESRRERWIWLIILTIKVYHPQRLRGDKREWIWSYSKNEHRRVWESVKMLERRGLIQTRIITAKEAGIKPAWGGIQSWMEVRKI